MVILLEYISIVSVLFLNPYIFLISENEFLQRLENIFIRNNYTRHGSKM